MRLIKHIWDVIWYKTWGWLARHGIGDPLNQLFVVRPYNAVQTKKGKKG